MKAFLAVTFGPDAGGAVRRVDERALACLRTAADVDPVLETTVDGWIAFAGPDPDDEVDPAGAFTVRLGRATRTRTKRQGRVPLSPVILTRSSLLQCSAR